MEKRLPVTTLSESSKDSLIPFLQEKQFGITLFIVPGSKLSQNLHRLKNEVKGKCKQEMQHGEVDMESGATFADSWCGVE